MPVKPFACTQLQFDALRSQLEASHITVPDAPVGQIYGDGIVLAYTFDGKTLTVTGVSKTGWVPTWGMIFDEIQKHLNTSIGY